LNRIITKDIPGIKNNWIVNDVTLDKPAGEGGRIKF
jgi:hypothetical protein